MNIEKRGRVVSLDILKGRVIVVILYRPSRFWMLY